MSRIVTSLSPNAEGDDIGLATSLLFQPWTWQQGHAVYDLEQAVGGFFRSQAITFESGRSALCAAIQALDLPDNSEIILQAFTCIAVPNSVRWAKCTPIYADVDPNTFTLDISTIELLITKKTRAILVQHTFGLPADMDAVMNLARKHNLLVIEDCAHSFGSRWKGQLLGTFGDVAIFSFGRDKSLSSVFGGVVITRRTEIADRLRRLQKHARTPSRAWIARQLFHPLALAISLKLYDVFSLGKVFLELTKRFHLISKAFEPVERRGGHPSWAHQRMANALATLALHQWKKRERFEAHRRRLTNIYKQELTASHIIHPRWSSDADPTLLRYPICTSKRDKILQAAARLRIELGDWYAAPIAPPGVDETAACYDRSKTPQAVVLSQTTLNLPTHINVSEENARRIIEMINTI